MEKCCLKKTAGLVGGGFVAALFALLSFALFSCSNMSGGGESSSKNSYPVVRFVANMQSDLAAAPQEISGLVSASAGTESFFNDGISRSAMPDVEITFGSDIGVKYYVEAVTGTKGTDSYIRHFVYGTTSTLELGLESGNTWNVTCGIGEIGPEDSEDPNSKKIVLTNYMSDNDPSVTISPDNPVYAKTFGLKPSTEGNGKVDLTFYVDSDTGIDNVDCLVVECADLNIAADFTKGYSYSEGKIVFQTDSGKTIPSGCYEFVIKFLSSSGVLLYATSQTINVFDNMTTNSWRDDGSGAFRPKNVDGKEITAFHLDQDLVTKFVDNTIYVGATGFGIEPDDNNAGTAFTPLNKLDAAFKRIAANGNEKDYRIYICGTIDQPNFVVNSDIISAKAASITIEGYNGLDSSGNPKDKILAQGGTSVFSTGLISVNSSVPITTKNIWLAKKTGASGKTRGLYLYSGANVTLGPGTVISGFDAGRDYDGCSGGGVYVASGATLTVKGAVIKDNYAYEGGGLCVAGDGSVTMSIDGSQITGNHALYGGGISVKGAKVKITKTSISGNKADLNVNHDSGGGLSLDGGADVTLGNGVVVQGNTARIGGGVNMAGGTLTLEGGQIIQNKAVIEGENAGSGCGGGIDFTYEDCNVYVYDGSISGNTANNLGGAIHFNGDGAEEDSSHSLYVTGGTIENNTAAKGGAIYIYPTNEDIDRHFTFTLGGSAYIPYGVDGAQGEGKNDIYFDGPNSLSYASIALPSALSKHGKTNPVAVRIADAGAKRGVPVVKAASPLASLDACKDSFKLYSDDWNLKLSSDKKTLSLDAPIWVAGSGAKQCTGTPRKDGPGTKSAPYKSIYYACAAMTDPNVDYTILVDGQLYTADGIHDAVRAASITIQGANGNNSLDVLNGQGSVASHMLSLLAPVDVTIKDLKITGAKITAMYGDEDRGGGVYSPESNTVTLSSGTLITGNKAANGGAGVCKINGKLVIEDGAEISQNEATGTGKVGGGLFIKDASLEMTGGLIKENKAVNGETNGGGIYFAAGSTSGSATISGGTITKNTADKGGGVYMNSGPLYMSGGVIGGTEADDVNGNTATALGGGLYIFSNAKVYLWGKALVGRSDVDAASTSSLSGKKSNTARNGGGIYVNGSGQLWLGYKAEGQTAAFDEDDEGVMGGVIGNYASFQGGGIWTEGYLHVADGQIAFNGAAVSSAYGGGIYASGHEIDISGGSVANNRAKLGGAIYNYSAVKFAIGGNAYIPCGTNEYNEIYLPSYNSARVMALSSPLAKHKASGAQPIVLRLNTTDGSYKFTHGDKVVQSNPDSPFNLVDTDKKSFKLAQEHVDEDLDLRFTTDNKALSLDKPIFVAAKGTKDVDFFYCGQQGDDTEGDGSRAKPYASIEKACSLMTAALPYSISVDGSVKGPQVVAGASLSATSVTIYGSNGCVDGVPKDELNGEEDGVKCALPVLKSEWDGDIVLQGIRITGSGNTQGNGGGVYKKNGRLFIGSGAEIVGNSAHQGAGVYILSSTLFISGGRISKNTCTKSSGMGGNGSAICSYGGKVFLYGSALLGGVDAGSPSAPSDSDAALAKGGNVGSAAVYLTNTSRLYLGYSDANDDGTPKASAKTELKGGIIGNHNSTAEGGGAFLDQDCSMYIDSGEVAYNTSYSSNQSRGGGIRLHFNCSLTMSGGKIHHNKSKEGGGVLVIGNSGQTTTFTMTGGEISENSGQAGAGVNLDQNSIFNMSGGIIKKNISTGSGGGVYNEGCVFMYGSAVIGDVDEDGKPAATVTGWDDECSNKAGGGSSGGGIYNSETSYLYLGYSDANDDDHSPKTPSELTGGIFCNCAGSSGGGIYNEKGKVYINSGTIQGNCAAGRTSASRGGGIYVANYDAGSVTMTGGLVKDNRCPYDGKGVYFYKGTFTMGGSACIMPGSDGEYDESNDLFIDNSSKTLALCSNLEPTVTGNAGDTAATYAAKVKLKSDSCSTGHQVLSLPTGSTASYAASCDKIKIANSQAGDGYSLNYVVDSSGKLDLCVRTTVARIQTALYYVPTNAASSPCKVVVTDVTSTNMKNIKTGLDNAKKYVDLSFESTESEVTMPDDCFYYCSYIVKAKMPDFIKTVGKSAFKCCENLKSVDLNAVTAIGDNAFESRVVDGTAKSSLTSITIPNTVTTIGNGVFKNCVFTSITLPSSVTSMGTSVLYGCKKLTSFVVPSGITELGASMFNGCEKLSSVTLPDSLVSIGASVFYGCSALKSLTIPAGVKTIGNSAFCDSGLQSITIPSDVESMGKYAFQRCLALSSITFNTPAKLTAIENYTFSGCESLGKVTLPQGIETIGENAFGSELKSGPSNIVRVYPSAQEVVIPKTVKTIKGWAFHNSYTAEKYHGAGALDPTSRLKTVTFESGSVLESIGENAFWGCTQLTSVEIPDSATSIGEDAFRSCSSLTTATIGSGINFIGEGAFSFGGLTSAVFKNKIGWKAGDTEINSTDLASTATAATYLKDTYRSYDWTRE